MTTLSPHQYEFKETPIEYPPEGKEWFFVQAIVHASTDFTFIIWARLKPSFQGYEDTET